MRTELDNFFGAGNEPAEEDFNFGPYMTLEDYLNGVNMGIFGPDEACFWVHITDMGHLKEEPIKHPNDWRTNDAIAVAYYPA